MINFFKKNNMNYNNMFDPNMMKNLDKMMKNFKPTNNQIQFDFKSIRKYLVIALVSIFMSGFGVGLLIGLMF